MEYLLIGLGILFILAGIIGAVLPVLPGPPLSYAGLLMLHFTERYHFSNSFLVIWAVIALLVYVLDYIIPVWGTKRFGGSKQGIRGTFIGLIFGIFFFPPLGIIIGPFAGAVIGELFAGKNSNAAFRSGLGSFIGFLTGTVIKLTVSGLMAWHFATKLIFN